MPGSTVAPTEAAPKIRRSHVHGRRGPGGRARSLQAHQHYRFRARRSILARELHKLNEGLDAGVQVVGRTGSVGSGTVQGGDGAGFATLHHLSFAFEAESRLLSFLLTPT